MTLSGKILSILFLACLCSATIYYFEDIGFQDNHIKVCFVPGDDCEAMIISAIDTAHESIDVQAYHLSNNNIVGSLMVAEQRGVNVRVILDKVAEKEGAILIEEGIPVLIDYKRAIAHNKVMIIDGKEVITGSFNFSESAQKRNVENALLIENKDLAKKYEDNFMKRLNQSRVIQ